MKPTLFALAAVVEKMDLKGFFSEVIKRPFYEYTCNTMNIPRKHTIMVVRSLDR
jgi:hypothetical protein